MTQQAVAPLSILSLFCKEAPVDRHASWVSEYGLYHAPDEEGEEDMKSDEEGDDGVRMQLHHELVDEDEVVKTDEDDNPGEVWVDQPTTHELT